MAALIAALITGFTTGGLSCMAVQGGLLASSLAQLIEKDLLGKRGGRDQWNIGLPIFLFLISKLAAYTILGGLLGGLGKLFQLDPLSQAVLQFIIAFFIIGNALRMLNVHPLFRYFTFEPPAFITRLIRKKTRQAGSFATPIMLGAMTVLIPCGVTQTMMAAA
ncbi:MAG TPA: sulfite exporter TauE/SafE family protein, partial [Anaerolineaceae bacterium]|nr:sulfite exporter TauE/SafE family protein [Anaerolineaceae bacterium]